jgi:nitrogenase molybdenum-iron protein NifN
MKTAENLYTATRNSCKLCAPLGASLVLRGIEGAMPFLHGSQGCSTYIRRYLINHFKEPVDIASSNFSEKEAIFGGKQSLISGLENICKQYQPKLIGVATTCLTETIGDDVEMILREFFLKHKSERLPEIVHISTPSYIGTHMEGFHTAVLAVVSTIARKEKKLKQIGIFPGLVSSADIRYLKEIVSDFDLGPVILPDYSETLDGGPWEEYQKIQQGGTTVEQIASLGDSLGTIELGHSLETRKTASVFLEDNFSVPRFSLGLPIGIKLTDLFFNNLKKISGKEIPCKYQSARARLIDAYVDGHKYIFGKKVLVYGEEDLVIAVASFLFEIGAVPVFCATGEKTGTLKKVLPEIASAYGKEIIIREGYDFEQIGEESAKIGLDFMLGNSKGYYLARKMGIPLIRIGFPIHDRLGGQRILHLGYGGTQQLFDRILNAVIEKKQETSPVGYSYM